MRRRLPLLGLCLLIVLSACAPAPRPGVGSHPLAIYFVLRASLDDAIDVCDTGLYEGFFENRKQALDTAEAVASAIGIQPKEITYDIDYDPGCASVVLDRPLTIEGKRHVREFRLTPLALEEVARSAGYTGVFTIACTPGLPTTFQTDGAVVDEVDCEMRGFRFPTDHEVALSFHADATTTTRGTAIALGTWMLVLAIGTLLFRFFDKRDRWVFFLTYPGALASLVLPFAGLVFLWVIAYAGWIGYLPSWQLIAGLQGIGTSVALALPPMITGGLLTRRAVRTWRETARNHPEIAPDDAPDAFFGEDEGVRRPSFRRFIRSILADGSIYVVCAILVRVYSGNSLGAFMGGSLLSALGLLWPRMTDIQARSDGHPLDDDIRAAGTEAVRKIHPRVKHVLGGTTPPVSGLRTMLATCATVGARYGLVWDKFARRVDLIPGMILAALTIPEALFIGLAAVGFIAIPLTEAESPSLFLLIPAGILIFRLFQWFADTRAMRARIWAGDPALVLRGWLVARLVGARSIGVQPGDRLMRRLKVRTQSDIFRRRCIRRAQRMAARRDIDAVAFAAILRDAADDLR